MIRTKRIYEPAAPDDGYRVLVERLWPRGMRKAGARLDAWAKAVAPSHQLRRWYGHDPAKWEEFRRRYAEELRAPEAQAALDDLAERGRRGDVTLLFAAREGAISNAAALERLLSRRSAATAEGAGVPDGAPSA